MSNLFQRFKAGLAKTRQSIAAHLSAFTGASSKAIDFDALEMLLYQADFGPEMVEVLLKQTQAAAKSDKKSDGMTLLRRVLMENLKGSEGNLLNPIGFTTNDNSNDAPQEPLQVLLLLGINGVGKTTTAAKLAHFWEKNGQKTLLGSCDTFRAGADQQLRIWADRLQLDCIGSQTGSDAASVAYDVCQAGMCRHYQRVILDTAGRLHTKQHLLKELGKMVRVLHKCNALFPQHRWLVIDGSLGVNSLQQAKLFHEAIPLTGMIVTKLDGTSKGGGLMAIYHALHVPIYGVGFGEKAEDLQPFSITAYVDALLNHES